jgi:hypothetical protein
MFATPAYKVNLLVGSDLASLQVMKKINIEKGLSSAITYDRCPFQIISFDAYDQVTFGSMELGLPMIEGHYDLRKSFLFRFENYFPCLSSVIPDNSSIFEGKSTTRVSLLIRTSTLAQSNLSFLEKENLTVSVKLRTCESGEYFDMEGKRCVSCEPNFYSFRSDFFEPSACKTCENEPFFCYGGSNLSPKKGFWRSSSKLLNL